MLDLVLATVQWCRCAGAFEGLQQQQIRATLATQLQTKRQWLVSDRTSILKHPQTPLKRKHPWCGRFFNSAATTTLAPVSVGLHIRLPGTGEFLEFSEFHASPVAFSQGSSPAFAWRPKRMPQGQGSKEIQRAKLFNIVQC